MYNNHELVAKLIRMSGGILKTDDPAGIFCLAASKGNIQMLRLLHENGIDRNAVDYDDRSALHLACADKQILSVNHLLYVCQVTHPISISASISRSAGLGWGSIMEAVMRKNGPLWTGVCCGPDDGLHRTPITQAEPNIMDRWKGTPLEDAIQGGCTEAAVLLVGAGGRLGELGDQSMMQALQEAPTPDVVRNTVAELERKVANGFLYADMLDKDDFVNFTRKAVVSTLEKAIGLQVRGSGIALQSPFLTSQAVSRFRLFARQAQERKVNACLRCTVRESLRRSLWKG